MHVKNDAVETLGFAFDRVDSLIAASMDFESGCGVFTGTDFTEDQKRAVRIYVETWIREPLNVAIRSIKGDRSFTTEAGIRDWSESRPHFKRARRTA